MPLFRIFSIYKINVCTAVKSGLLPAVLDWLIITAGIALIAVLVFLIMRYYRRR